MRYVCNCSDVSLSEWEELMKDNYPIDYQELVSKVKRELPRLYKELTLDYYNPYGDQSCQTKTHYILVHSAIEYFIEK